MNSGKRTRSQFEDNPKETLSKIRALSNTKKEIPKDAYQNSKFKKMEINSDGNCLFRSILYFLAGDDSFHLILRGTICGYMVKKKK